MPQPPHHVSPSKSHCQSHGCILGASLVAIVEYVYVRTSDEEKLKSCCLVAPYCDVQRGAESLMLRPFQLIDVEPGVEEHQNVGKVGTYDSYVQGVCGVVIEMAIKERCIVSDQHNGRIRIIAGMYGEDRCGGSLA
jgi:hypothetical protein